MKLGAILGPINTPVNAGELHTQAANLEKAGYESLWAIQAIGRGFTVSDPLIALSVAATVTKCELGTAILQLPLYEPMDLAHRVYSLMQLAEQGFVLGLGAGSTKSDFTALKEYKSAKGNRAIISTIQVDKRTDTGELREKLVRFSEAGFDDAVVMFLPGGPSPDKVRTLV